LALMSLACAVIVSLVCFHDRVTVVHKDWGLGRSDTMTAPAFTAESRAGDDLQDPDWRELSESCVAGFCVRYHRHCTTTPAQVRCDYEYGAYGRAGDRFLHRFSVRAPTPAAFAAAERRIALLASGDRGAARLSLGALNVSAEDEHAPACPRRPVREDCTP